MNNKYFTPGETTKLIRKVLKGKFPEVKFSVSLTSYRSVRISYTDSKYLVDEVETAVAPFEGKGFDGMIDLEYQKTAYMMPDGTVKLGTSSGSSGSGGMNEPYKKQLPAGAIEVSFSVNYIFVNRDFSPGVLAREVEIYNRENEGANIEISKNGSIKCYDYHHDYSFWHELRNKRF